jgi:hypothetical protein
MSPTPGTVWNLDLSTSCAYTMRSLGGTSPESASHMMGLSSGLTLVTMGGSMLRGRRICACAILVWISCSETSTSRSSSSSTVMEAWPCLEEEVISRTPCTEVTASSMISTTSASMISGAAPSQVTATLTMGKSTSGICETPMRP